MVYKIKCVTIIRNSIKMKISAIYEHSYNMKKGNCKNIAKFFYFQINKTGNFVKNFVHRNVYMMKVLQVGMKLNTFDEIISKIIEDEKLL